MQKARGIPHSIKADPVLSPKVVYEPYEAGQTAIFFKTKDDQFGRVSFEKLDSLKVSRGEYLPFEDDWDQKSPYPWIYRVENSLWLKERYDYESKHYGKAYEFGGNVEEMLTDFSHFIFSFHDEFVEVIARGFWIELDKENLEERDFLPSHPFLPLPETNTTNIEAHGLTCKVRINPQNIQELIVNTEYCFQKLMEFILDLDKTKSYVNFTLFIGKRSGELISSLIGYKEEMVVDGVATLEQIKPFIESWMQEVSEPRKLMGK